MSNSWLRILTALVGIPLFLWVTYLGGWAFTLLVLSIALGAQWEVYQMLEKSGARPYRYAGLLLGGLVVLQVRLPPVAPLVMVVGALLLATLPFRTRDDQPLHNVAATVLGVCYPSLFLACFLKIRLAGGGAVGEAGAFALTVATVALIWATDTGAYYAGKKLGRHLLAPVISPRKTREGAVGGALAALGVAVVFKQSLLGFLAWPHVIALALLCGVLSQLGDLAESKLKRAAGVKDSGTLLPGHGGLLDRFDALILSAPLVYLYLTHVAGIFR